VTGPQGGAGAAVSLQLRDDDATRALWPQAFELTLSLQLHGKQLAIELGCVNTGATSFAFSAALHSYFAVDDITTTRLEGLQGTRFLDTTCDREQVDDAPALAFDGVEIDRIHWGVGDRALTLRTPTGALRIEAEGFGDAVVWNPGAQKAAGLNDLSRGDEARFVCVEAAAIGVPPQLAPGGRWRGVQKLTALG
jgi:glucose-6-phosphate 1-epimerase